MGLERLIERQRALLQPLGQRVAVQELHDQEVDAVLVPNVEEGANVRVVQAGDGLGLALEPLLEIGVRGDVPGEDFDGDGAVQTGVSRFVDFAHAARAEGGFDLVGAECGTGIEWHGSAHGHALLEFVEFGRPCAQRQDTNYFR